MIIPESESVLTAVHRKRLARRNVTEQLISGGAVIRYQTEPDLRTTHLDSGRPGPKKPGLLTLALVIRHNLGVSDEVFWCPPPKIVKQSRMMSLARRLGVRDYPEVVQFRIDHLDEFWSAAVEAVSAVQ